MKIEECENNSYAIKYSNLKTAGNENVSSGNKV